MTRHQTPSPTSISRMTIIRSIVVGLAVAALAGYGISRAVAAPAVPAAAQDQAPNRRDLMITAKDFTFTPARLEVTQDDLVRLTVKSEDIAYSLTIDAYRIAKRVPPRSETTFEFRADRTGTFPFYSSLTSDPRHAQAKGELIVRAR